jgi:hypothetical protein
MTSVRLVAKMAFADNRIVRAPNLAGLLAVRTTGLDLDYGRLCCTGIGLQVAAHGATTTSQRRWRCPL